MSKNLLCFLGFHKNGEWTCESKIIQCIRVQYCEKCHHAKRQEFSQHSFSEWKLDLSLLSHCWKETRICERCGYQDSRYLNCNFSSWKPSGDRLCEHVRTCKRCGYKERKYVHQHSPWEYLADDSCEQVRICQGCGEKEQNYAPHQFGSWEYTAFDSCRQVRVCQKCGLEEKHDVPHQPTQWTYIAENSCDQVLICQKCGFRGDTRSNHSYGSWEYVTSNTCKQIQTCNRCGDQQFRGYHENPVFIRSYFKLGLADDREDFYVYECTRCSANFTISEVEVWSSQSGRNIFDV